MQKIHNPSGRGICYSDENDQLFLHVTWQTSTIVMDWRKPDTKRYIRSKTDKINLWHIQANTLVIFRMEGGGDREEGRGLVESWSVLVSWSGGRSINGYAQFLRIHRSVSLVWALSASNNVSITVYIFKKLNLMTFALKERGLFAVAF